MKKEMLDPRFSWDRITSSQYWDIFKIANSDLDPIGQQVAIVSTITGIPEEEVLNMDVSEGSVLIRSLSFLEHFSLIPHYRPSRLLFNGVKYDFRANISDMTVAQFIDYQTIAEMPFSDSYDKLLSVFMIPEGHDYSDGYDILEVQRVIREQMTWREVQSLLNFMLVKFKKSLDRSRRYLTKQIKKMKPGTIGRRELVLSLTALEDKTNQLLSIPGVGLIKGEVLSR